MDFRIKKYLKTDSTNEEAFRLIAAREATDGLVVLTSEQTDGRGTGQNRWESHPGKNLTFSLILRPSFLESQQQFALTEMISLALFDVLEKRLGRRQLFIKWPNDLWFNDKKLAGILIQNMVRGNKMDFSVIGVGLNVNQKTFSPDIPNPGSLVQFTGRDENPEVLLDEILRKTAAYYAALQKEVTSLRPVYLQRLYRFKKKAGFRDASGNFTGTITGLSRYGELLISDAENKIRRYGFKEVEFC